MTSRAEQSQETRAWYDERDSQIAKRAGLTLAEFRSKSELARRGIMSDPEAYRAKSPGQPASES